MLPARTAYETALVLLQSIPQKWYPAQDLHPDALRRCVLSAVCLLFHQQGIVGHSRPSRTGLARVAIWRLADRPASDLVDRVRLELTAGVLQGLPAPLCTAHVGRP